MKCKELDKLRLFRVLAPREFEQRLLRANREKDAKFFFALARLFSLKPRKRISLRSRVEDAFYELGHEKLGLGVTKQMIKNYIDPKIDSSSYSRAFRAAGLSYLPKGKVAKKI
jgi:hypothetical protein